MASFSCETSSILQVNNAPQLKRKKAELVKVEESAHIQKLDTQPCTAQLQH